MGQPIARARLREQLVALNGLLPGPLDIDDEGEEVALVKVMAAATAAARSVSSGEETAEAREWRRAREVRQTVAQWMRVAGRGKDFEQLIATSSRVVAATCSMSGKGPVKRGDAERSFGWAIVDEAGRATAPEALIPIVRAERAILVGDERQLPPMIDDELRGDGDEAEGLGTSLFQSLAEQMDGSAQLATLRTQYRMHDAIGNLISTVFYDGALRNGVGRAGPDGGVFGWMPARVMWFSTSGIEHRREARRGASYENRTEADVVCRLLEAMESRCSRVEGNVTVGVISGYSAQVERLLTSVDPDNDGRWGKLHIEVATVDSFQGRECDIVVYSTVRSNTKGKIGFLKDFRRVNVALSRAREVLAIVGDGKMMESATLGFDRNPFAEVIGHMEAHPDQCRLVPAGTVKLI